MFQDISIDEILHEREAGQSILVDVRSPKEFNEATIPGSLNIPVFTNEERAEVGTIYKQEGSEKAKDRGLEIFSQKLPAFIAEFKKLDSPVTVFCWRGGMRSKTAATVLDLMGVSVKRLSGGVRTYRQHVVHELETIQFETPLIVLNGCTGSGKTEMLLRLQNEGYPIIDLEGLAGHRGSIFGQIGLEPSNQKKFESLLLEELMKCKEAPFVCIEGESKRIGKVSLPAFLMDKKAQGLQLVIDLPMEERAKNIIEDYEPWLEPQKFTEAFELIRKRLHTPIAKQIHSDLVNQEFISATMLLLEHYYDPRYNHSWMQYPDEQKRVIQAQTIDEAYDQVLDIVKNLK